MTCEGLTLWLIEKASIILGHFTCLSTCCCMEEVTLWTGSRQLNLDKLTPPIVPGGWLPRPSSHRVLWWKFLAYGMSCVLFCWCWFRRTCSVMRFFFPFTSLLAVCLHSHCYAPAYLQYESLSLSLVASQQQAERFRGSAAQRLSGSCWREGSRVLWGLLS